MKTTERAGAGKMAQWVKVLPVKPDGPSSIPGLQIMGVENSSQTLAMLHVQTNV